MLGAETTDCDSPVALINETFRWIQENLRDEIDFVIWTGDSARHDNDEQIPRTKKQVLDLNNLVVNKFVEVFGKDDNINDTNPTNDFIIPIVPNFGNNDIMPHNIFTPGPNRWTEEYLEVWRKFIPEAQRHGFERGGWFSVEVITNRLTIFSINSLYFFSSNAAVDGCAKKSEPGYEQMEWLRVQLQFVRDRGMKAILIGHVPPARTSSKQSWDETCWQKMTLWLEQYRDVVVGSMYGHMNIDHFMLQDFADVSLFSEDGVSDTNPSPDSDDELLTASAPNYLDELRAEWSKLPDPPNRKGLRTTELGAVPSSLGWLLSFLTGKTGRGRKDHKDKAYEKFLYKIGGPWAERFSLSLVSPSVVPNYYPTLRVFQYNITGLEASTSASSTTTGPASITLENLGLDTAFSDRYEDAKTRKEPKYPKFKVPNGPSKSSPPGPAYSPQTFTWLGYTQYYANLTTINRDFSDDSLAEGDVESSKWKNGKHSGKKPKDKNVDLPLRSFKYQEEYNTRTDKTYRLKDLTVRSYFDLANRIGQYKSKNSEHSALDTDTQDSNDFEPVSKRAMRSGEQDQVPYESGLGLNKSDKNEIEIDKKKKKHRQHKNRKDVNRVWLTFVRRAFVGSWDEDDLYEEFG